MPGYAPWSHYHDALLACFAQADGALRWQRTVAKSIDTLELVDERLYLACDDEILVLDAASGETLISLDTGLRGDYDRSLIQSSLHVEGDHLYFCHPGAAALLVYRLDDLALLRRLDIPPPYSIERFGAVHPSSGKLYFHLSPRESVISYYHLWPLLELDPDNLDANLTVELGPAAQIELRPAADEPGREEVWIELAESSLDEALIHGERHAEDQAYYHGQFVSVLGKGHAVTRNFNGLVHLRVRCRDAAPEQVQERLAILVQRFASWVRFHSLAAGSNPRQPVTLDARDSRLP